MSFRSRTIPASARPCVRSMATAAGPPNRCNAAANRSGPDYKAACEAEEGQKVEASGSDPLGKL